MSRARFRGRSRSGGMFSRAVYPLLAVGLVLPTAGVWWGAFRLAKTLPISAFVPLFVGAGAYVVFHLLFRRPMTAYVLGHELTHAAAALLSGYKVKSLFVSEKGGEVHLSNSNVAVALAPYCWPLYTSMVLLANGLVQHYADLSTPPVWAAVGVGLTLAFHAALTVHALNQDQPDLRHGGRIFSLVTIAFCNGLFLVVVMKCLFPNAIALGAFLTTWMADTRVFLDVLWQWLCWVRERVH
jgi:FtsH-binding integral membrane protein